MRLFKRNTTEEPEEERIRGHRGWTIQWYLTGDNKRHRAVASRNSVPIGDFDRPVRTVWGSSVQAVNVGIIREIDQAEDRVLRPV